MDITIHIPRQDITSIDSGLPLSFQVKDEEYQQGLPAIGEYIDYDTSGDEYRIIFELIDDAIMDLLSQDIGYIPIIKDGELVNIIAEVDEDTASKMRDILKLDEVNRYKRYDIPLCSKKVMKICEGGDCKGCDEPVTFTDCKGRAYEVVGLDVVEKVKQYMTLHKCDYETALRSVEQGG